MIWTDNEDEANQWTLTKKSDDLITKINSLKQKSSLTISEGQELEKYTSELHEIQKSCSHLYKVILLFHWHRKYCEKCHKEDTQYRHNG